MKKPFYSVVSNKGESHARINIYGVIGPDWYGEGIEAKRFVKDFSVLESSFDRINIHINSPGGSIWDGLPIFNAIRASQKDIHTYVDGIAFSMGFMIAIAGHTVHAAKGSILMAHNASGGSWGNAKALRKGAEMLDKHDIVLGQLIADKTGKTLDEVNQLWMNMEDNFMTATEAVEYKLVDVLETYAADEMPENVQSLSLHQIAAFYNERSEEPNPSLMSKIISGVTAHFQTNNNIEMKFLKIVALAGEVIPTAEQLEQANADLATAGVTKATLVQDSFITDAANVTAERDTLQGTVTALTTQLGDANTAKATAEANLTAANATITGLQAQVEAFGKNAGATNKSTAGADAHADEDADQSPEAIMANLPHNKAAAAYLG